MNSKTEFPPFCPVFCTLKQEQKITIILVFHKDIFMSANHFLTDHLSLAFSFEEHL